MRVLHIVTQTVKWVTVEHRTPKRRVSEDVMDRCDILSLADAGFEEDGVEALHGLCGVPDTVAWWSDGEDSRYEDN